MNCVLTISPVRSAIPKRKSIFGTRTRHIEEVSSTDNVGTSGFVYIILNTLESIFNLSYEVNPISEFFSKSW